METQDKITELETKVNNLELKFNSLFSLSSFPLDLENILISRGFYNVGDKELELYYEGGVGGNTFSEKYRLVKFRDKQEYLVFMNGIKTYTVNTTSNVCFCSNNGFSDGQYLLFRTTDTFPVGLDSLIDSYTVINATQDTFQVTTDGVNPVDITSSGIGDQYVYSY